MRSGSLMQRVGAQMQRRPAWSSVPPQRPQGQATLLVAWRGSQCISRVPSLSLDIFGAMSGYARPTKRRMGWTGCSSGLASGQSLASSDAQTSSAWPTERVAWLASPERHVEIGSFRCVTMTTSSSVGRSSSGAGAAAPASSSSIAAGSAPSTSIGAALIGRVVCVERRGECGHTVTTLAQVLGLRFALTFARTMQLLHAVSLLPRKNAKDTLLRSSENLYSERGASRAWYEAELTFAPVLLVLLPVVALGGPRRL